MLFVIPLFCVLYSITYSKSYLPSTKYTPFLSLYGSIALENLFIVCFIPLGVPIETGEALTSPHIFHFLSSIFMGCWYEYIYIYIYIYIKFYKHWTHSMCQMLRHRGCTVHSVVLKLLRIYIKKENVKANTWKIMYFTTEAHLWYFFNLAFILLFSKIFLKNYYTTKVHY